MGWEQTLRRWTTPRARNAARAFVTHETRAELALIRSRSLCIASGKGGTGKSIVAASLAHGLSARGRTLLVDADMGVGNAHILQDLSPERSFVDVVARRCELAHARVSCSPTLDLVGGGSGVSQMSALDARELCVIADGLRGIENEYDYVLVDSAAGISEQTVRFAASCDAVLVVTTPDLTAMTDAYAFIKVLHARRSELVPLLVVNRVAEQDGPEHDGEHVAERIGRVCDKFLGLRPTWIGTVPEDRAVPRSVASRAAVVRSHAHAPAAIAMRAVERAVVEHLTHVARGGVGRRMLAELDAHG